MEELEKLPAFYTWKMLRETIQIDSSVDNIKRLIKIIQKPVYSHMFVNTMGSLGKEEQQQIDEKYQAFTSWVLGEFFYFLSQPHLTEVHPLIIDIQKRILHNIKATQSATYQHLISAYINSLKLLNNYIKFKDFNNTIYLSCFEPDQNLNVSSVLKLQSLPVEISSEEQYSRMQCILLKFMDFILIDMLDFHCFDESTKEVLRFLLCILNHGNLTLKMEVLKISSKLFAYSTSNIFVLRFKQEVCELFELLFNYIHLSSDDFSSIEQEFDEISCKILLNFPECPRRNNICSFVLSKDCKKLTSEKLIEISVGNLGDVTADTFDYFEIRKTVLYKKQILEELKSKQLEIWPKIKNFSYDFFAIKCKNDCSFSEHIFLAENLLKIAFYIKFETDYLLLEDPDFFFVVFNCLEKHISSKCLNLNVDFLRISRVLIHIVCLNQSKNADLIREFFAALFRKKLPEFNNLSIKNQYLQIHGYFSSKNMEQHITFESCVYFAVISSVFHQDFYKENEQAFMNIFRSVMDEGTLPSQILLAKNAHILLSATSNFENFYLHFILPLLTTEKKEVCIEFLQVLPKIYLLLCKPYCKTINADRSSLMVDIEDKEEKNIREVDNKYFLGNFERKLEQCNCKEVVTLIKTIFAICLRSENEVRVKAIRTLPFMAKDLALFYKVPFTKCLELIASPVESVRSAFCDVIFKTVENTFNREDATAEENQEILKSIFEYLLAETDKSLRSEENFPMQETIVTAVYELTNINHPQVEINIFKISLYFIVMFTSTESGAAAMNFVSYAKTIRSTPLKIYLKHRREMCKVIAKICLINFRNGGRNLSSSLEIFAAIFWNSRAKMYIAEETRYLLPFFIKEFCLNPKVAPLIEEIASYHDVEIGDLLADNYGYIYVHNFLNEDSNSFKSLMKTVESRTGLTDTVLKKNNYMAIVNVLLENFHENREKVLQGFKNLASEDRSNSVLDFLQPRLLGILQYFEIKLLKQYCDKKHLLLSLSEIFKYMGPKFITPVRFKIIAMLRTVLAITDQSLSTLNCQIWDSFLRVCELEALGPQLATIMVSIQPLMHSNCNEIAQILNFLIVEHESLFKNHLIDLFFVLDFDIDNRIVNIIRKQVKEIQQLPFKEHLMFFMKYFTYETVEVQIYALKYIRQLLKGNRENISEMILGFNGMDACVCELLEFLTKGCREYDRKLRISCGECLAELGAIEPSHLPLVKKPQDENGFNFFITDAPFIINSLNEFARAMKLKKNSQSMDKFLLAIQETLKIYGISNKESNNIWNMLSESQKEVMIPLLTSKYFTSQNMENIVVCPVYGSYYGSNFQSWLTNWTVKLISKLETSKKQLFTAYIPSMKQDLKILMFFLPYILLNSLIDGCEEDHKEAYEEFMAVIKCQASTNEENEDLRPLKMENFTQTPELSSLCNSSQKIEFNKVVFVIFDFLERWITEWVWENGYSGRTNDYFIKVKSFLTKFNKFELAKSNFECGGYPRALMYLEDYMMELGTNVEEQNENLALLSEIYYRLGEPDGVSGVTALRKAESTLEQRILHHEVSGRMALATSCYERLPTSALQLQGLVRSQLDLDNVHTALYIAKGVDQDEWTCDWMQEVQAEAMWRLGSFDDLEKYLQDKKMISSNNWGVRTGFCLLHLKNGDRDQFKEEIQKLKMSQINYLGDSTLEEGTYQHGYFYISRLHALNELEQLEATLHDLGITNDEAASLALIKEMKKEWDERLNIVQQSCRTCEPILCLRRAGLLISKEYRLRNTQSLKKLFDTVLGDTWLKSAAIAMNSDMRQKTYSYLLKAEEYNPPTLFIEKAKWFWLSEKHEEALTTLKRGLSILLPDNKIPEYGFSLEQRKICADAKLLIASYNAAISNVSTDANILHYKEAIEMLKESEKSYVYLAQYYDRVYQNFNDEDKDAKGSDMQIHMINFFGKSLQYGTSYIYQSMPRLLSIWFDYGTRLLEVTNSSVHEERKQNLLKMTKLIDSFLQRLPAFIFLTAFSQLISRICHPQKEVYKELNLIIAKLILKYPQQTLWMMISVIKSSYTLRSKRCIEILGDPKLKTNATMVKLINDFTQLAEKLIELTNKPVAQNVLKTSVNALLRTLPRLICRDDFSPIMIPVHKFRKLILPTTADNHTSSYNPFPNHYVYIVSIKDEITVLPSLQRPRRITFVGSDGKEYIQMLKPKDDLRKDFRLMEFNDIVNQLLSKEAESRERRLNIRLYSVAPLNEECGLIEWIPNLVGLRPTLMTIYKQKGLAMKAAELKDKTALQMDKLEKKRDIYLNILLPRHPPVLGEWFRRTFPDAHGWLTARTAFIRTTAVMSMVGHILGLGDRHGENILLDSTCGDVVHVDFNCLFNKGESFEWPERVPFRLTPNMVAAMGPLGVEGLFRKSCAVTLRVLRTHTDTLMSIVTPFVYDPLVSWPKRATIALSATSERTNDLALEHIRDIQKRLQGKVNVRRSRYYSIPLSVEGQTENLIAEAINVDNLCQMYIGWGPYL